MFKILNKHILFISGVFILVSLFSSQYVLADDTEVYGTSAGDVNMMLMIDASGSMLDKTDGTPASVFSQTRMNELNVAVGKLFEKIESRDGLNVGLTYFGGTMASGIKFPVSKINAMAHDVDANVNASSGLKVSDLVQNMITGIFPIDEYSAVGVELHKLNADTKAWYRDYKSNRYFDASSSETEAQGIIDLRKYDMSQVPECTVPGYMPPPPKALTGSGMLDVSPSTDTTNIWVHEASSDTLGSTKDSGARAQDGWYRSTLPSWYAHKMSPAGGGHAVDEIPYPAAWFALCPDNDEADNNWKEFKDKWSGPDGAGSSPDVSVSKDGVVTDNHYGTWTSDCRPGEIEVVYPDACLSQFTAAKADTGKLYTSTVSSYYEIFRYFSGEPIFFGNRDHFPPFNAATSRYGVPSPASNGGLDYDLSFYDQSNSGQIWPGLMEDWGFSDKEIYAQNKSDHFNSGSKKKQLSGPLYGWRAAHPSSYEKDAGAVRKFIPVTAWSDTQHIGDNIFDYSCDFNTGGPKYVDWLDDADEDAEYFIKNSFNNCNIFDLPFSDISLADHKTYFWKKTGKLYLPSRNTAAPQPTDIIQCEFEEDKGYCSDTNSPERCEDGETPATHDCVFEDPSCSTESECGGSLCSGTWVPPDPTAYEADCEFKYESVATYKSPINECSPNVIITISDGHPTANIVDNGATGSSGVDDKPSFSYVSPDDTTDPGLSKYETGGLIRKIFWDEDDGAYDPEVAAACDPLTYLTVTRDFCEGDASAMTKNEFIECQIRKSGACGTDLINYMYTHDLRTGDPLELNAVGDPLSGQYGNVKTYTIGFALSGSSAEKSFLDSLAVAGGGFIPNGDGSSTPAKAIEANDAETLVTAIEKIIDAVGKETPDRPAISLALDKNTLQTKNRVFVPMFKSEAGSRIWNGNIKGFYLQEDPNLPGSANYVLGSGTSSFGSSGDASNVAGGGVNAWIEATDNRKIYVEKSEWPTTGAKSVELQTTVASCTSPDSEPWLDPENFGLTDPCDFETRNTLIEWFRNQGLADSLHATPAVVDYGDAEYLFAVSNRGLFHTFSVPTDHTQMGRELTAWMPHSLLSNIKEQYQTSGAGDHIYGIDSEFKIWRNDVDGDGNIEIADGDFVYLYFGMRRGGMAYYCLDVTNPEFITLKWRIESGDAGFEMLGESWSPLSLIRVKEGATDTTRSVGVFGGGYNKLEDKADQTRAEIGDYDKGLGIYFIDLLTGERISSIVPKITAGDVDMTKMLEPNLKYAIPSEIRAISVSGDGYADRLYFGDMGGQLWRVDINTGSEHDDLSLGATSSLNISMLANLGVGDSVKDASLGERTLESNRRFYYPPAIAFVNNEKLAIATASGFRAHPLDGQTTLDESEITPVEIETPSVQDRLYMIYDTVGSAAATITEASLYNATNDIASSSATGDNLEKLNDKGWKIDLHQASTPKWVGEKSLGSPTIFLNRVFFTTFTPAVKTSACGISPTTNKLYSVKLTDATASGDLVETDENGDPIPGGVPVRSVDIPTTTAIDTDIRVNTSDYAMTEAVACDPSDSDCEEPDPSASDDKEVCVEIGVGENTITEICDEPYKVYWKETAKMPGLDCRFDTDHPDYKATCIDIVEEEITEPTVD